MAHKKTTSKKVASIAGKLLQSSGTLKRIKSVAASTLAQKHRG